MTDVDPDIAALVRALNATGLRGRYLWDLRAGDGSLLAFEAGQPLLAVVEWSDAEGRDRRSVRARGQYSFALHEGVVSLHDAEGYPLDPGDPEDLDLLGGQAIVLASHADDTLRLELDLGGTIELKGALVWTLDRHSHD